MRIGKGLVWPVVMVFLLVAVWLAGCGGKHSENEMERAGTEGTGEKTEESERKAEKIRVGYHPNFGGASATAIGLEQGFFEEEGLEVELVQFTSGPPSVAALQAGDVDVSFLGHGAYGLVIDGQADVIAVDCLSNAEEILVRADSGITGVEQLAGKRLATPFDTSGENFLDTAMRYYGMDIRSVRLINMDVAGCVTALADGKVDAVSVWAPYSGELRRKMGADRVVTLVDCMDFRDTFALPMSWVATDEYLKKNRDTAVKFIRALYRAMDYRNENTAEAASAAAALLGMEFEDLAQDTDTGIWLTSEETRQFIADGTISRWYEDQRKFFLEKKIFDHPLPLQDYLRLDLMEEALR